MDESQWNVYGLESMDDEDKWWALEFIVHRNENESESLFFESTWFVLSLVRLVCSFVRSLNGSMTFEGFAIFELLLLETSTFSQPNHHRSLITVATDVDRQMRMVRVVGGRRIIEKFALDSRLAVCGHRHSVRYIFLVESVRSRVYSSCDRLRETIATVEFQSARDQKLSQEESLGP